MEKLGMFELLAIAAGLSMDAFAVSVCKGLSLRRMSWGKAVTAGIYFGGFQAAMPLAGYLLGVSFRELITNVDHWIAFALLTFIGANMIRESKSVGEKLDASFSFRAMVPLAVATSIDALAAGVTFAFLKVDIVPAVCFIGVITFIFSVLGIKIGNAFGARYKSGAEFAGGLLLILMAVKILLDHLGFL